MSKFVLRSETQVGTVTFYDKTKTAEQVLEIMQRNEPDANWMENLHYTQRLKSATKSKQFRWQ
jgi:hypothetical protein